MKRLKSFNKFNEGTNYSLQVIKDMLLDFSDKDIDVRVSEGSWRISDGDVDFIEITIGKPNGPLFSIESCLLDVIDYLEEMDLVMMDESWYWNEQWQHYQGCPNCLSSDFEDNYNLSTIKVPWFSQCNRCHYIGPPDRFLLGQWPVTRLELEKDIKGRKVEQIKLLFSKKKSLFIKESLVI